MTAEPNGRGASRMAGPNHFSKMRALTKGEAMETAAMRSLEDEAQGFSGWRAALQIALGLMIASRHRSACSRPPADGGEESEGDGGMSARPIT
jgi:hypothetical protein